MAAGDVCAADQCYEPAGGSGERDSPAPRHLDHEFVIEACSRNKLKD